MKPAARKVLLTILFAAATFGFGTSRESHAQFGGAFGGGGFDGGFGGQGFGFVLGGFSQVPKPQSFLNDKALIDAGRDTRVPSRVVYANNSNSYINHIRDTGFAERYHAAPRGSSHSRSAQPPTHSSPGVSRTAVIVEKQLPSLSLASFYESTGQIVWPANSPVVGELKEKRTAFDQASQLALAETKNNGVASVATLSGARQKLLDYGRPALQYVRTHGTPRVADEFHHFLLSLYGSLGQADHPTATAAAMPDGPTAPPSS
jgi:hypothetical protein